MDKTITYLSLIAVIIIAVGTVASAGLIEEAEMKEVRSIFNNITQELLVRAQLAPAHNTPPPTQSIDTIVVSFDFEVQKVDPDETADTTDEYFINAVSQCLFHSPDDVVGNTCFICKLHGEITDHGDDDDDHDDDHDDDRDDERYKDSSSNDDDDNDNDDNGQNNLLGTGRVDLPNGYEASTTITIPITDIEFTGANDVTNVKNVLVEVCQSSSGCTPGFWKNHHSQWSPSGYSPSQKFKDAFGLSPSKVVKIKIGTKTINDPTLGQAIQATGGGFNALARHSVAALLNSASNINYPLTTTQVIAEFNAAYASGNYEATKDRFAEFNELGCPFGATSIDDDSDRDSDKKKERRDSDRDSDRKNEREKR
jgi:hypothetical protein